MLISRSKWNKTCAILFVTRNKFTFLLATHVHCVPSTTGTLKQTTFAPWELNETHSIVPRTYRFRQITKQYQLNEYDFKLHLAISVTRTHQHKIHIQLMFGTDSDVHMHQASCKLSCAQNLDSISHRVAWCRSLGSLETIFRYIIIHDFLNFNKLQLLR